MRNERAKLNQLFKKGVTLQRRPTSCWLQLFFSGVAGMFSCQSDWQEQGRLGEVCPRCQSKGGLGFHGSKHGLELRRLAVVRDLLEVSKLGQVVDRQLEEASADQRTGTMRGLKVPKTQSANMESAKIP
jgi:hypothetical protein